MGHNEFQVSVIGYGYVSSPPPQPPATRCAEIWRLTRSICDSLSAKIFHLPFIQSAEGLKLHSIVQRNPTKGSNSAPDDFPSVKHFTSTDAMVQDPEIDLVVVSTPPNNHFDAARQVLQSGKHVLVEKPFAPTSAQAEQLAELAREKGKLICAYHNRRWDADFLRVQKLIKDDKLGRIYEFETHFDRFRPDKPAGWKGQLTLDEGNGAVLDLGTHLIDQVFVLFGTPTAVYGKFAQQRAGRLVSGDGGPEDQADSADVMLTYAGRGGLVVHVRIGVMSVADEQPRFRVRGTKGTYHKTGVDPQESQLVSGMRVTDAGFGVDGAAYNGKLELLQEDGSVHAFTCPNVEPQTYLRFYELLVEALATGKEEDVPVPPGQAVEVLRIIEAVRESARSGKEVAMG